MENHFKLLDTFLGRQCSGLDLTSVEPFHCTGHITKTAKFHQSK